MKSCRLQLFICIVLKVLLSLSGVYGNNYEGSRGFSASVPVMQKEKYSFNLYPNFNSTEQKFKTPEKIKSEKLGIYWNPHPSPVVLKQKVKGLDDVNTNLNKIQIKYVSPSQLLIPSSTTTEASHHINYVYPSQNQKRLTANPPIISIVGKNTDTTDSVEYYDSV